MNLFFLQDYISVDNRIKKKILKDMHQHESSDGSGTRNSLKFLRNLEDAFSLISFGKQFGKILIKVLFNLPF